MVNANDSTPPTVVSPVPNVLIHTLEDRAVLLSAMVRTRGSDLLTVRLSLGGPSTGDTQRDERAGVFCLTWIDPEGREIAHVLRDGFSLSDRFGAFCYIAHTGGDEATHFFREVPIPARTESALVRVVTFSNRELVLLGSLVQHLAPARSAAQSRMEPA